MPKVKKKNTTNSKHDNFFKSTFSDIEVAKDFIQTNLSEAILSKVNLKTLTISKDSFVDIKLKEKYSDTLYNVKINEKDAYIYFLFEHKSEEDKLVALQLLKYMVEIWYLHLKQNKNNKKLPLIIPLLIYHGRKKWSIKQNFSNLLEETELQEYIPNFKYEIFDISHLEEDDIKGSIITKITLLALKYIFSDELPKKLPEIFKLFIEISEKERATEYLELFLRYLATSAKQLSSETLDKSLKELKEGGDIMSTIANMYIEKGRKEGELKGELKGKLAVARGMLKDGLDLDLISKYVEIKLDELKKLLNI